MIDGISGVNYPEIELGGVKYLVQFTRGGMQYRMSRLGVAFSDLQPGPKKFSAMIDLLYIALAGQYMGTPEALADLVVDENKLLAIDAALGTAIKKAFPSPQPLQETAAPVGQPNLDPEQRWLESWAYATSPYGLGLTSEQSWALTPREFHALEQIHLQSLNRWAWERADFRNAHFQYPVDGQHWQSSDFIHDPKSQAVREQQARDHQDLTRALAEDARLTREMRNKDFDQSQLPKWAQMTPQEKAARGIQ